MPKAVGAIEECVASSGRISNRPVAIRYVPLGPSTWAAAGARFDVGSFTGTDDLACGWGVAGHTGVCGVTICGTGLGLTAGRFTAWHFTVGFLAVVQEPEIALVATG